MTKKKVLICDDDKGILEMLELALENENINIITEPNSLNIYKLIEEEKPDLLLLDLWMPVLSGDQILKNLRGHINTRNLPVIVISASTDGEHIAKESGATDYVAKPFDVDDLYSKIYRLMSA